MNASLILKIEPIFFYVICVVLCLSISSCGISSNEKPVLNEAQIQLIDRANLIIQYENSVNDISNSSNSWLSGVYYLGLSELYASTKKTLYYENLYIWSLNNNWKIRNREYHADHQVAAYTYLSLYDRKQNSVIIQDVLNKVSTQLSDTAKVWWWSDALFMAPPVFQYIDHLNLISTEDYVFEQWSNTAENLFSEEDSLFFRDKRFNNHLDKNGNKQFWLRGNGWVIAGLALQLSKISKTSNYYEWYLDYYRKLAAKLVELQQSDGLWRMDLTRPELFNQPETSGTSLICYAITKGMNEGWLSDEIYEESIQKCYSALNEVVSKSGKLLSVQPVNSKPEEFDPSNSESFGSGTLLLFYSELFNYFEKFVDL